MTAQSIVGAGLRGPRLGKGMLIGVVAGMLYGLYSAFLTLGMGTGIWLEWKAPAAGLSAFVVIYLLSALGSAVNDSLSAVWALLINTGRGKLLELLRSVPTRSGVIVIIAAVIGGPLASTSYVMGLQSAGSIVIPITALCPAFGALLGRIFLKQPLNSLMWLGIAVCVGAGALIGFSGQTDAGGNLGLGITFALIAALGWGIEGTIGGFVTASLDSRYGIAIRQFVSGLVNVSCLLPILAFVAGDLALVPRLLGGAFTSWPAVGFIAVSGLASYLSWVFWYRGNELCGTALGMACNATYSFWGPLCCWLLLGLACGQAGWALPPTVWLGALIMSAGIFVLALGARRAE